jgi:hypothetical protein
VQAPLVNLWVNRVAPRLPEMTHMSQSLQLDEQAI